MVSLGGVGHGELSEGFFGLTSAIEGGGECNTSVLTPWYFDYTW